MTVRNIWREGGDRAGLDIALRCRPDKLKEFNR